MRIAATNKIYDINGTTELNKVYAGTDLVWVGQAIGTLGNSAYGTATASIGHGGEQKLPIIKTAVAPSSGYVTAAHAVVQHDRAFDDQVRCIICNSDGSRLTNGGSNDYLLDQFHVGQYQVSFTFATAPLITAGQSYILYLICWDSMSVYFIYSGGSVLGGTYYDTGGGTYEHPVGINLSTGTNIENLNAIWITYKIF